MLKAIIIDDETHCAERVTKLLKKHNRDIEVVDVCHTVEDAKIAIENKQPEVIFLDIQLQDRTGFDLLNQLATIDFEIIFTTAYNHFAVDAFKCSALDYLLKPIIASDFDSAIDKLLKKNRLEKTSKKIENLIHNLEAKSETLKKIAIPTIDGFEFITIADIIRCRSDGNYTRFELTNERKTTAAKTLKYFEDLLPENNFFRIHKSHLINLNHIDKYIKGKGGYVMMKDGKTIEVAVRRKEAFIKKLTTV